MVLIQQRPDCRQHDDDLEAVVDERQFGPVEREPILELMDDPGPGIEVVHRLDPVVDLVIFDALPVEVMRDLVPDAVDDANVLNQRIRRIDVFRKDTVGLQQLQLRIEGPEIPVI